MATATANTGATSDEAALLALKAEASGHHSSALDSWNRSSSFCSWEGVTCNHRKSPRVAALNLSSLGLTGTLSPAVGNLTFLQRLNLSYNELYGEIPPTIGRLRRLQTIDFGSNSFSGALPANLSFCRGMELLNLANNHLRGRIPAELGDTLTSLQMLLLTNNSFTGAIPSSLGNLSSLRNLSLAINHLGGTVPASLGSIQGMQYLDLDTNGLSGELPLSLYNLSALTIFEAGVNMLDGSIPADVGDKFPRMQCLSLTRNQFSGGVPASISNLSALTMLFLSGNRFSGYVPPTLGRLKALQYLELHDNRFEADNSGGWEFITSLANCSQLQELVLGNNSFTGQLPSSIVNLSVTLQQLYLGDNKISGSIPSNIGNLVNLKILEMTHTLMSGAIPESIGKMNNLVEVALYNTYLSGIIPSSTGNLTNLNRLYMNQNNLEGPIPTSLGNLKNLFEIDLSYNYNLNGSIPKEIFGLSALWFMDLSYNSLSGPLPSEVGNLANLNQLILSSNRLSGQMPHTIEKCEVLESLLLDKNSLIGSILQSLNNMKGLRILNLTMNKLAGRIPYTLGSINGLQQLYLAHNNMSGPIPAVLQNLTILSKLDVSFNNLEGEVPTGGVFKNLTYVSVAGNRKLCGGIPQLHLSPCPMHPVNKNKKGSPRSLIIALATIGAIMLLVSAVVLIRLLHRKLKQRQKDQVPPTLMEEKYQRISYHALSRGTNGFSEANLIGKGRYGVVYKCTLEGEDITMAVKVFNLPGSSRSFDVECKALRRLRHRCLVKIITCCSSIDPRGQEFKALVFEFMPNGSLEDWLHPKSGDPILSNTLSLAQRLHIAVDVVDAIDYLHSYCRPLIIHCDLKPSNILLGEDMSAQVGDFEYGEGCAVSTDGDVYSLGVLLLEMFTGRRPTDDMFRGSLDLHKFAEAGLPARVAEIVDPTIWLHEEANGTDITSASLRSRIQECLVSVIGLGISCSKQQPKQRMPIRDVATEMHTIRDAYLRFASSLMGEHGRDIEDTTLQ